MALLHTVSILLEAIVALLGALIAVQKRKPYGWLITLTFTIYVYYDLARYLGYNVNTTPLYQVFFLATLSALAAVWMIYREKH